MPQWKLSQKRHKQEETRQTKTQAEQELRTRVSSKTFHWSEGVFSLLIEPVSYTSPIPLKMLLYSGNG